MWSRLKRIEYIVSALLGVVQVWLMSRLDGGDFFNSYPFISDDGFDWIAQGVAFNERLGGVNGEVWPVLRNPVFVLVTALDDAMHASGAVIILANGAAVSLACASLGWLARRLGYGPAAISAVLIAYYFSILGFWRLWILSDTLCQGLMTASFCLLIAYHWRLSGRLLLLGAFAATAAGLTQTYGIIPFCVVGGVTVVWRLATTGTLGRALPTAVAGVIVATIALQKTWAAMLPHNTVPQQFGLLKISLEMLPYYANTWMLAFGSFVPAVVTGLAMRIRRRAALEPFELGLVATAAIFALLTFLYQWRESRFTFIWLSVFFAVLLCICRTSRRAAEFGGSASTVEGKLAWACSVAAGFGLCLAPLDYWSPKVQGARIDWTAAWVGEALRAKPVDRFDLARRCGTVARLCPAALAPPQSSPYRQEMFDQYKRRTENDTR